MIRAKVTDNHFLFGISNENLRRLKEGMPIHFNLTSCGGPDMKITIMWGPTEEEMANDFRRDGFIGPETKLNREK